MSIKKKIIIFYTVLCFFISLFIGFFSDVSFFPIILRAVFFAIVGTVVIRVLFNRVIQYYFDFNDNLEISASSEAKTETISDGEMVKNESLDEKNDRIDEVNDEQNGEENDIIDDLSSTYVYDENDQEVEEFEFENYIEDRKLSSAPKNKSMEDNIQYSSNSASNEDRERYANAHAISDENIDNSASKNQAENLDLPAINSTVSRVLDKHKNLGKPKNVGEQLEREVVSLQDKFMVDPENVSQAVASWFKNGDNSK